MLWEWAAVNDGVPGGAPASSSSPSRGGHPTETDEAREGRLRAAYAGALQLHADRRVAEARETYQALATELAAAAPPPPPPPGPLVVTRAKREGEATQEQQTRARKRPRHPQQMAAAAAASSSSSSSSSLSLSLSAAATATAATATATARAAAAREAAEWTRVMRYAVRRNLGDVLVELGEHRAAMETYAAALDDDPDDMPVWLRAGRAAMACGHLHIARRALEEALKRRPEHWRCVEEYRRVLQAIGDADEDVPGTESSTDGRFQWRTPTALSDGISSEAITGVVKARHLQMQKEKELALATAAKVDSVPVSDPTWMAVITALAAVIKRRQGPTKSNDFAISDSVRLELQRGDNVGANTAQTSPKNEEPDISGMPEKSENVVTQDADESAHGIRDPSTSSKTPDDPVRPSSAAPTSLVMSALDPQEISSGKAADEVAEYVLVADSKRALVDEEPEEVQINSSGKSQEVRKSKRQLELGREQRRDQLRSNDAPETPENEPALDWNISEHMSKFLPDIPLSWGQNAEISDVSDNPLISERESASEHYSEETMGDLFGTVKPGVINTRWNHAWSEVSESAEVAEFVTSLNASSNGGPVDLLHRVMTVLLEKVSVQYMPQIARTWLLLQPHFAVPLPGSLAVSSFVVESLLASGDESGKNKRACFHEAKRLVAAMQDNAGCVPTADDTSEGCRLAVRARSAWAGCQLAERTNEHRRGFHYAVQCIRTLSRIRELGIKQLPLDAGPLLGGKSVENAFKMVKQEGALFYNAIELENARTYLSNAKKLRDPTLTRPAIQILGRNVRVIAQKLALDSCSFSHPNQQRVARSDVELSTEDPKIDSASGKSTLSTDSDGLTLPDVGSKNMAIISSQLDVYQSACSFAGDDSGELAALAIRTKILVIQLTRLELTRTAKSGLGAGDLKRPQGLVSGGATEKISAVVAILRKFVASIKNVTGMPYTRCGRGISAWSSSASACYAARALIAVSHVLAAKIPPVGRSFSTPLELSVAEKNQRLAFTRAILGFVRCVAFLVQGEEDISSHSEQKNALRRSTRLILDALSFSLHVLAPRGCVREEGTSGALIRLYLRNLSQRLRELSTAHRFQEPKHMSVSAGDPRTASTREPSSSPGRDCVPDDARDNRKDEGKGDVSDRAGSISEDEHESISRNFVPLNWDDVSIVRQEIAQCYRCLYKLPDLECLSSNAEIDDSRWLAEACSLSRRVGLSFAAEAAPMKPHLDLEACLGAFGFYRKYLFEALACQWRDGKKSRRARDVIAEIATSLPADFPPGVPCIPLPALDSVVSLGLENGRGAVAALKEDWERAVSRADQERTDSSTVLNCSQLSRMYHEVYVLHMMTILTSYESEFKKQKVVERRKAPKEVVERLINAASNDCIGALRARPWSPGAWVLLGRVVLEVADVALDERAVASSTFGLCRGEDLASGDLGDPAVAILGRAEGCFRLAEALAKEMWIPDPLPAVKKALNEGTFDAEAFDVSSKLASTFCDGEVVVASPLSFDLFAHFGLGGRGGARSVRAAAQFGKASVLIMKLREERYRARHWGKSTIVPRPLARGTEKFPDHVTQLTVDALKSVEKGLRVIFPDSTSFATQTSVGKGEGIALEDSRLTGDDDSTTLPVRPEGLPARPLNAMTSILWYYMTMRAKLYRKRGENPKVYLPLFAGAMEENKKMRSGDAERFDIEPFYQLHVARLKVLLEHDGSDWKGICDLLMQYAFEKGPSADNADVDEWTGGATSSVSELHVSMRRAVGEDVAKAMTHCRQLRGSHAYSEFFFKSVYAKALIHWKIFNDPAKATEDLNSMFRSEAAAKAVDPGSDGVHRGYFFTIWNYRHTDTGFEVALETERKYLRWRDKLLGLFAAILRDIGALRKLAGIISRLKRRHPDDLPIDGALLDDIAGAHAEVSMKQVISFANNMTEKPTVALSEWLLRNAWDVFVETVRLTQGVKRARLFIEREPESMCGAQAIAESGRPWCVSVAASSLHLEHVRLQAAIDDNRLDPSVLQKYLCTEWKSEFSPNVLREYATTIKMCLKRWPVDPKLVKLIRRRVENYESGGIPRDSVREVDRKSDRTDSVGKLAPSASGGPIVLHSREPEGTDLEKVNGTKVLARSRKMVCETIDLEKGS